MATSLVPRVQASATSSWLLPPRNLARYRLTFSSTTIALSMSMPAASESPPSDIRFRLTFAKSSSANVAMIDTGIATLTTSGGRHSATPMSRTRNARTAPKMIDCCRPDTDSVTKSASR